jgi:hypothetical protein
VKLRTKLRLLVAYLVISQLALGYGVYRAYAEAADDPYLTVPTKITLNCNNDYGGGSRCTGELSDSPW